LGVIPFCLRVISGVLRRLFIFAEICADFLGKDLKNCNMSGTMSLNNKMNQYLG
jgi:hypothetical protein